MVSSVPASSEPVVSRSAPARHPGADRPAPGHAAPLVGSPRGPRPRPGAEYPSALVRFLTVPAAFFASNWAAMVLLVTVVGAVPALVASTRTTGNLSEYADRAFRETLRSGLRLLRRDGLLSLLLWGLLALAVGNVLILTRFAEGGTRVFLVGIALPPTWAVVSLLSAYVVAAARSPLDASRSQVARSALALVTGRPVRALLVPAVIAALTPLWLLAPLTIAIGFSVPPHFVHRFWGALDAP